MVDNNIQISGLNLTLSIKALSKATCIIPSGGVSLIVNPLHTKFFRGSQNIYLHFVSFLHIDMTQVDEILPQLKQELIYST